MKTVIEIEVRKNTNLCHHESAINPSSEGVKRAHIALWS